MSEDICMSSMSARWQLDEVTSELSPGLYLPASESWEPGHNLKETGE
jgi:hypothetical protein